MIDPNNELSAKDLLNVLALSANAAAIYVSADLHIQFANNAMLALWGKNPKILGEKLQDVVPELSGQPLIGILQNVWHTGRAYIGTEVPATFYIDGAPVTSYLNFEYHPILNPAGKTYCILHTAADVTDKVTYKRLVKEKEEREQQLNEELTATNEELAVSNEEMTSLNEELAVTNEELSSLNEEYVTTNEELTSLNEEYTTTNESLVSLNLAHEALNDDLQKKNEALEILGKEHKAANKQLQYLNDRYLLLNEQLSTTNAEINKLSEERQTLNEELNVTNEELRSLNEEYIATNEELNRVSEERQTLNEKLNATNEELQSVNEEYQVVNEELKSTNDELQSLNESYLLLNDQITVALETANLAKNAANFGTFDLDIVNDKLDWDDRCKELFGLSPDVSVTYTADFVNGLHLGDKRRILKAVTDAYDFAISGGNYDVEYRTVGAEDKKLRWVRAIGKVIFNAEKKPLRFIGIVLDITEQKEDEQRKNDFIGMVSHELKTPLTSLNGYLQMMQSKYKKTDDTFSAGMLDRSVAQIKKMTNMINGFLNVSRFESGKIHIDKREFDMAVLVKDAEEETIATVTSHKVIFHPVEKTIVIADKDKIGQVITNFISNAVKYSPQGSTINVACVTIDNSAKVSITDEGMGIPQTDLGKLFDRYYRVEGNHMKSISGFGIGLYLSSEIIKRHGGNIGVESKIGQGSTFWFTLPLS